MSILSWFRGSRPTPAAPTERVVEKVKYMSTYYNPGVGSYADFTGDKFFGGFGATKLYNMDYWTLRARSEQLFTENLYASGIVRRLVTNEVNTGLELEAAPLATILGLTDEYVESWCERVEDLHKVWQWNAQLCDYRKQRIYGQIVTDIRTEALITGDVLVVLRRVEPGLPCIQTIPGAAVCTPLDKYADKSVQHGVEVSKTGEHVAYYIRQADGTHKRLPARAADGTRVAWLVYGSMKRMDSVRGLPLLSVILQSLKEIDRYRDSALRKAVLNSMVAIFIKKTHADQLGTMPLGGSAIRKEEFSVPEEDGGTRNFNALNLMPGTVLDELAPGEEPVGFDSKGTDIDFPEFEKAVLSAIAWSLEIPYSKMTSQYSSNYSASQAEINDFKTYLNKARTFLAADLYQPVYEELLYCLVLINKIEAPGFLESRKSPTAFDTYGAWVYAEWPGVVQPSTDILKTTKALAEQVAQGFTTIRRASRELNGTSSRDNFRQLLREQTRMAEIKRLNNTEEPQDGTDRDTPDE